VNRQGGEAFNQLFNDSPGSKDLLPFIYHSKCYTRTAELSVPKVAIPDTFDEKWRIFRHIDSRLKIMVRYYNGVVQYAPLYVHSFKLRHRLAPEPAVLTTIADKLKHYRYAKALKQSDIADYAGIFRSTYIRYESGMENYPLDKLEKIAELQTYSMTIIFSYGAVKASS
jgi:DNA-binding XRE family transcriptional regulator